MVIPSIVISFFVMASMNPKTSSFPGGFDLRHRLKFTQEGLEDDLWYVTHLSMR